MRGRSKFAAQTDMEDTTNEDFDYFDRVFTQRVNLWMDSDHMRQMLVDELGSVIGSLARELSRTRRGYRLWHDQALYKEPYANPTS